MSTPQPSTENVIEVTRRMGVLFDAAGLPPIMFIVSGVPGAWFVEVTPAHISRLGVGQHNHVEIVCCTVDKPTRMAEIALALDAHGVVFTAVKRTAIVGGL